MDIISDWSQNFLLVSRLTRKCHFVSVANRTSTNSCNQGKGNVVVFLLEKGIRDSSKLKISLSFSPPGLVTVQVRLLNDFLVWMQVWNLTFLFACVHGCLDKFLAVSWIYCEVLSEALCWVVPYSPPLLRNSFCSTLALNLSPKHNRQFIPSKTDTLALLRGRKSGDRNGKKSPICRFSDLANFSGVPFHQEILTNLFSHIWIKILLSREKCPSSI